MAVVFGPREDVFFLSYGRRFAAQSMPQSFLDKVQTGELAPMSTSWISMDPGCRYWVARNFVTDKIYFSNNIPLNVRAHVTGTPAAVKSNYISFPAEPNGYFAKHIVGDGWSTDLHPVYENAIIATRQQIGEHPFDTALRRVLFGRSGTFVLVFETWFIANLEGACTSLKEALGEFHNAGWSLDAGSTLSVHNEDHYFLKFSKKGVQGVQIRANMPQFMEAKLVELMEIARDPEEARELAKEQQIIQQILAQRNSQQNQTNPTNHTVTDSITQGSLGHIDDTFNTTGWQY